MVGDLKITGDRFTVNENGCRAKTLAVDESCLVKISVLGLINGVQQSGELRMGATGGDSLVAPLTLDVIAPQTAYLPPIVAGADLRRSRAPDKCANLRKARLGTAATSSLLS